MWATQVYVHVILKGCCVPIILVACAVAPLQCVYTDVFQCTITALAVFA